MDALIGKHWHHLQAAEVVDLLDSNPEKGLDQFEVKHLQETFGPNAIIAKKGKGPLKRFLLQFHQPLLYILIVSGTITALLQEWVDSGVIFGVVQVNAIIGYIQEAKAVNALAALARTITTVATVLRQGEKKISRRWNWCRAILFRWPVVTRYRRICGFYRSGTPPVFWG